MRTRVQTVEGLQSTVPVPAGHEWTGERLASLNRRFREASPEAVLEWGLETFAPEICLASSFGLQSIVLMHLLSRLRPETTVFYLDTELLFLETYALRDRLRRRLGMTLVRVTPELSVEKQAEVHGPELWKRDPDRCCEMRKVLPLRRFLSDKRGWITGLRHGTTLLRNGARKVEWDPANALVKLNPLLDWSTERIWEYVHAHELPFNTLHKLGYPSIGCRPCTRPVRPGEDPRSGRWTGFEKTECGIHHGLPEPVAARLARPVEDRRC